ncbi:MAG: DUF3365 domain-containing protein [Candidatus Zixiibacteriota bacterium]
MRFTICILALLVGVMLTTSALSKSNRTKGSNRPKPPAETSDPDTKLCRDASKTMVMSFARTLKTQLSAAMKKGTVNAINVCGSKAPEITASQSTGGWIIKRVSDRNRNEDNAPDSLEKAMLAEFSATKKNRPIFKDFWTEKDGVKMYHFYEPIVTQDFCLRCHGDKNKMDSTVVAAISTQYPHDLATGYSAGDVRGMFVVETTWPEGRAQALALTGGR